MNDLPVAPTVDSVLSVTPASGTVTFTSDDESWTARLIGWAVVVTYRSLECVGDGHDGCPHQVVEYETNVQPLVIFSEDGMDSVETVSKIRADMPAGSFLSYRVEVEA